jgi:hypothetical protein
VPGLRLSDYRYWRIDGIIPEGFQATGKFTYNVNSYLDNTLLTSSTDTLVILYRQGAAEDWQEIEFEKVGPWNVGNIIVPGIKAGEYTLAVKETGVGASEPKTVKKNGIKIYPNPSSGNFTIACENNYDGECRIYNESGMLIEKFRIKAGLERYTWITEGLTAGTYYVTLTSIKYDELVLKKAIYIH